MKIIRQFYRLHTIHGFVLISIFIIFTRGLAQTPEQTRRVDTGSWYSILEWPHDGSPFESENFIIYSDDANREMKQLISGIAEKLWGELISEFDISDEEVFNFPPDQDKIHIYAYKHPFPQRWGGCAYWGGVMIWSLDHKKRPTDRDHYSATLKHELVHVIQFLLQNGEGIDSHNRLHVENWFSEGLAEAMVGGCSGRKVKDKAYLQYLIDKHGKCSPISFKEYEQVAEWSAKQPKMAGYHYLFPMYNLAVDYILDEEGFGKKPHDLASIFIDISDGKDFSIAFENRVGISLAEYEYQFFDLMDSYLPEGEGVHFRNTSLVWLVLVTMSLICIFCGIAGDKEMCWYTRAIWVLIALLFGPLGWLGFLLFRRCSRQSVPIWKRALWASIYNVAGNALGLVLLCGFFAFILPAKDPLDFVLLVPFLVGWLVFRTPIVASHYRTRYIAAAIRALPVEIASTILVLTGMLALLVTLSQQWWFSLDPRTLLFWPVVSLGATAGAMIVYPFNLLMVRRNSATSILGQSFDSACFDKRVLNLSPADSTILETTQAFDATV